MNIDFISIDIDGQLFGFRKLNEDDKNRLIEHENPWFRESDNYFFKLSKTDQNDRSRSSDNIRDNSGAVSLEISTPKKIPDYVYDEIHTKKIRLEKLENCQLMILSLKLGLLFFNQRNYSFAESGYENLFMDDDFNLNNYTFNNLIDFLNSKDDTHWLKNTDAFVNIFGTFNWNMRDDASFSSRLEILQLLSIINEILIEKLGFITFGDLITNLSAHCRLITQTMLELYHSFEFIVRFVCREINTGEGVMLSCLPVLVKRNTINTTERQQTILPPELFN